MSCWPTASMSREKHEWCTWQEGKNKNVPPRKYKLFCFLLVPFLIYFDEMYVCFFCVHSLQLAHNEKSRLQQKELRYIDISCIPIIHYVLILSLFWVQIKYVYTKQSLCVLKKTLANQFICVLLVYTIVPRKWRKSSQLHTLKLRYIWGGDLKPPKSSKGHFCCVLKADLELYVGSVSTTPYLWRRFSIEV